MKLINDIDREPGRKLAPFVRRGCPERYDQTEDRTQDGQQLVRNTQTVARHLSH